MIAFQVRLTSLNNVGMFVKATEHMPCDVTVRSGPFSVNGKSLMGILSLDLTEPLTVEVQGGQAEADRLKAALTDFLAE